MEDIREVVGQKLWMQLLKEQIIAVELSAVMIRSPRLRIQSPEIFTTQMK